ncbi:MAG: T9SS type A sorting domain-containing protein, partial [Muribaculaceae bacterium]|nr:T9SS type A sorting domain-containing protein [Muribaculaceae bacterium]
YYIVTRTRYVGGEPTVEELLAEEPGVQIDNFDLSDSESYSVRSCRLGVESPESNVVFVTHAGITDAEMDVPFTVATEPGLIVVRTVAATDICIYDVAGRLLQLIPDATGIVELPMPAGVYIVATGRGTNPAKVTVL